MHESDSRGIVVLDMPQNHVTDCFKIFLEALMLVHVSSRKCAYRNIQYRISNSMIPKLPAQR